MFVLNLQVSLHGRRGLHNRLFPPVQALTVLNFAAAQLHHRLPRQLLLQNPV